MRMLVKEKINGQVLLLSLMAMAVLTTIVGTSVLRSMVATRTERQNEAATQAENAAKGLQEAQIGGNDINPADFEGVDGDSSHKNETKTSSSSFISPYVIPKDGQYLFYMTTYDSNNNSFGTEYYVNPVDILYDDTITTGCPVLEVIRLSGPENKITRVFSSNTSGCESITYQAGSTSTATKVVVSTVAADPNGFTKKITIPAVPQTKLLIIRPYFAGTKLGFEGTNLKPQGREISSTIRTVDGVQKTEKTYQLFPQIPLGLFATTF